MRYMRWGWADYLDAPLGIRDKIIETMRAEVNRPRR